MALITAAQLRLFAPRCDYMALAPHADRACAEAGIDTPRELRHFLAQMHHESVGFTRFEESLNWRTPERLDAYFKSVRSTEDAKALIARGPQAIANRIYAGKAGNGPESSGDGWRFRGRSPIQLTGRANYQLASGWIGANLLVNPDLAALPAYGFRIAAQWWRARGLNAIVAADPDEQAIANIDAAILANELDDARQARRIINGGQNGIDDVILQLRRAATIWRG
jgi:putative chitinase